MGTILRGTHPCHQDPGQVCPTRQAYSSTQTHYHGRFQTIFYGPVTLEFQLNHTQYTTNYYRVKSYITGSSWERTKYHQTFPLIDSPAMAQYSGILNPQ